MKISRPRRLYEQIAGQIGSFIHEEQLKPGMRLPAERDLAQQLGVSRPSVREALIALEAAGLVETRVGGGTFVRARPVRPGGVFALDAGDDLGPGPLEQFEARRAVEPACAELAAVNASAVDLETLRSALARMTALIEEGRNPAAEHRSFHVSLAEASRNGILAGAVRELWALRQGRMWDTLRKRVENEASWRLGLDFRSRLLDCLEARVRRAARAVTEAHFERIERLYFGEDA
jgi:DNA-binding FadR family transcriptional regulator